MRQLHTDSHLRLAMADLADSKGYVDTLLGLARDQIMAQQPFNLRTPSHARRDLAPREGWVESRTKLH
jgi:hypothetical protein